jgi:hypothetical protein
LFAAARLPIVGALQRAYIVLADPAFFDAAAEQGTYE